MTTASWRSPTFGIETLTGLIDIYKTDPDLLKRSTHQK
jgi:hypothetical protein